MIVIQCAAAKNPNAGRLLSPDGKPVIFVADPPSAPNDGKYIYARPDDFVDGNMRWRQAVLDYNKTSQQNPLGLVPAYQLYRNPIYDRLVSRFGSKNVYILSAGWGLLAADFLTPYYDITFKQGVDRYKRRKQADRYADFCMPPHDSTEEIVFFGGKDYVPFFAALTVGTKARRIVFYNSLHPPDVHGCVLTKYQTSTRTNWQYDCANAFLDGKISI